MDSQTLTEPYNTIAAILLTIFVVILGVSATYINLTRKRHEHNRDDHAKSR